MSMSSTAVIRHTQYDSVHVQLEPHSETSSLPNAWETGNEASVQLDGGKRDNP